MRHLLIAPLVAAALLAGCATPRPSEPFQVKVLAINDFHGNLKPPQGGIRIKDPADPARTVSVPAGGAEHLASAVNELRARNPNHVFVAAGDLIGATPLISALFRDEPTIEALSLMGLEASAVGNHEFDKGADELLRLQRGGCDAPDACKGPAPFKGAGFRYLAASTVVDATGQTLLPGYHVKHFQGVPVAFIGLTLKDTPTIVVPAGVRGLTFRDEAETVNGLVPELRRQGVEAFVVLIHEGGYVNDPRDPGGETRWGISQRNHPSLDIKTLTREQAVQTYRRLYWQPLQGDALHKAVAFALFGPYVNHGLRRAVAWLQNIVGTTEDGTLGTRTLAATQAVDPAAVVLALHARRLAFYTDLDTFSSFGRGWTRRMAQNLRYAAEDLA